MNIIPYMNNCKRPIEDYSVEEFTNALKRAERFIKLAYSVQGAALVKCLTPSGEDISAHTLDEETRRCFSAGYVKGLEAGVQCFPASTNDFSMRDILEAFYGADE